jgi:hypothetical protein
MAGISARRGVAEIHRGTRCVLNGSNESTATAHDESVVPIIRKQQLKSNVLANDAGYLDVRLGIFCRRSFVFDGLEDNVWQTDLPKLLDGEMIGRFGSSVRKPDENDYMEEEPSSHVFQIRAVTRRVQTLAIALMLAVCTYGERSR